MAWCRPCYALRTFLSTSADCVIKALVLLSPYHWSAACLKWTSHFKWSHLEIMIIINVWCSERLIILWFLVSNLKIIKTYYKIFNQNRDTGWNVSLHASPYFQSLQFPSPKATAVSFSDIHAYGSIYIFFLLIFSQHSKPHIVLELPDDHFHIRIVNMYHMLLMSPTDGLLGVSEFCYSKQSCNKYLTTIICQLTVHVLCLFSYWIDVFLYKTF